MGKFIIKKTATGFKFDLKAGNGEPILASEVYTTKPACENGIESVKKNSAIETRFEKKTSTSGQFYFNLKASNGQVIGTSEMYNTAVSMENGIKSVMKNGPDSPVVDES